jgi:hypothetical protein
MDDINKKIATVDVEHKLAEGKLRSFLDRLEAE